MNRKLLAVFFLVVTSLRLEAAPQAIIAFQRDSNIWVANLDGTNAKKIAKGTGPDISADGTRVAFNTEANKRQIAVADIATGHVRVFTKEIPSENCYGAVWSPDGSEILFNIWTDNQWHLAAVQADGSGFRYIKKAGPNDHFYYSGCWAPDNQSIYAQDMDKLYQFSLEGKELRSWNLKALLPNESFSSNSRFTLSPDGRMLLVEADMDEETPKISTWDGPPPSLWTLEIASQKTTRLTPKGVMAWDGCWIDNERILCTSQTVGQKQSSISEMALTEKSLRPVLKNAMTPTVSRPARQ